VIRAADRDGYVIGVDGGTTKTVALVAARSGEVIGAARGPGSNIYAPPDAETALDAAEWTVRRAVESAGVDAKEVGVAAYSMSGADWPEDFEYLSREFTTRGLGREIIIVNDAVGGLRAGAPDGVGAAVVCGTGGATAACAPNGKLWHSSFWQGVGGSIHLASRALKAVYRADLRIGPPTTLTARALALFDQPTIEDMLHLLTGRVHDPHPAVSRLGGILLDEAEGGDPVSIGLVRAHGEALGDYAAAAVLKVGLESCTYPLVLTGGVLRHPSPLLADALIERVQQDSPGAQPVRSRFEPAVGALLIALDRVGVPLDAEVLEAVASTAPDVALYDTR